MSSSPEFWWTDYLDLADRLASGADAEEARLRTAISRAYYAAFHVAMELIVQEGFRPTGTGGDHGNVWRWYREGPGTGRSRKQIAQLGFALRLDREKADYRIPFEGGRVEETAKLALTNARHIVDWVGRVRAAGGEGRPRSRR